MATSTKTETMLTQRPHSQIPAVQWKGNNFDEVLAWWRVHGWGPECEAEIVEHAVLRISEYSYTPRRLVATPSLRLGHWAMREGGIRRIDLSPDYVEDHYMGCPW